jgi:hypothetical protein
LQSREVHVDSWKTLIEKFNKDEALRRDKAKRAEEEAAERRAFDDWCASVTEHVMLAVCDMSKTYAAEFEANTGASVAVKYPARGAIRVMPDGPHMSFLRLELLSSRVEFYAHRGAGSLPFFHFMQTDISTEGEKKRKHDVMASIPACYAARGADGSYELRRAGSVGAGEVLKISDLVVRAFELLVEGISG